jgi:ABC-2 type transport system permease protein
MVTSQKGYKMRFFAIMKKDILILLRNTALMLFLIYIFTLDIYLAGIGIKVKPQNVSVGYVDYSNSLMVNKILSHLHKPEFQTPIRFLNEEELKKAIADKKIMVGLVFDSDFSKNYYKKNFSQLNVLIDSTASAQAQVTVIYLNEILARFVNLHFPINIRSHRLFNQNSNSTWFMSLAELMSDVVLLVLLLVAAVFVKEKEDGTWDIMLLMPVSSILIIFAKMFSQVIVILIGVWVSVGIILFGVFDVPINGNLWHFFILNIIFAFSLGGIGLVIAAVSKNVTEVGQYSFMVMMPLIFLSGAWTPISSMAPWLQKLSIISPVRYYIEASESIFFRGSSFYDLLPDFIALLVIGVVLFYIGYRKIGKLF